MIEHAHGSESDQQVVPVDDTSIRDGQESENNESKDDIAESSSISSSTEKSGNGGYNADCSSDQSSDGTQTIALTLPRLNLERSQTASDDASSRSDSKQKGGTTAACLMSKGARTTRNKARATKTSKDRAYEPKKYRPRDNSHAFASDATELDAESSSASDASLDSKRLRSPQWKDKIITTHSMDPRIDLSVVRTINSSAALFLRPLHQNALESSGLPPPPDSAPLCVDSYLHLMEAVQPFFRVQGMHYTAKNALQQPQGNESGASSKPGLPLDGLSSSYTPEHSIGEKAIASPLKSDSEKEGKAALEDDQCTKRKHALQYEFSDTSSSSSSSSLEKRVRIQDGQPQLQQQRDHPNFNHTERLSVEKSNVLAPRIVTDVSSSNQTNTTTSGSGSGGNSGSNQGSSGSGNDGKGSSEEHAKDNSGDGTNGSDASTQRKVGISLGHGLGPVHRHASLTEQDTALKLAYADKHDDKGTGGRKLIDKRRKRIEMRREYEAQQEFESSGVSDTNREQYFRPGRPLSLDQVLVFSKIPRIVVQGSPPFLVVHTNAAYCRLTGIDSHIVAGKPISFLLSLQKDSTGTLSRLDDTQQAEGLTVAVPTNYTPGDPLTIEANGLVRAEANGRARAEASMNPRKEYSLERLIATSGFGHIHVVHVNTRPFQMVGRDVTILKEVIPSSLDAGMHSRNEEVNCTSVASGFEGGQVQHPPISCRISIAPIISSTNSCDSSVVMTDQEAESHPKGKRAKHHFGTESNFQQRPSRVEMSIQHCKYQPLQFARYFVIQLQALSDTTETTNGMESLSSNSKSVEANLLGLTKEGLMLQRHIVATGAAAASPQPAEAANLLEDADVEADAEASTEGEAVAALG